MAKHATSRAPRDDEPLPVMQTPDERLEGFSGCELTVLRSDRATWVRKRSPSIDRNYRISAEVNKLRALKSFGDSTKLFRTPEIYSDGIDEDGKRFYEMQFIVGQSLETLIEDLDPIRINKWADRIAAITHLFEHSLLGGSAEKEEAVNLEGRFLIAKLTETLEYLIAHAARSSSLVRLVAEYEAIVAELRHDVSAWSAPASFSHGDLALDNVLIDRNGELYLIDPLANCYESYLWDAAKILQSCHMHWRQVKSGNFILESNGSGVIVCPSYKLAEFERRFAGQIVDPHRVTLYLGVTIARIVKYARDERQTTALLILANRVLNSYATNGGLVHELARTVRW